jgi:hypothetical protein
MAEVNGEVSADYETDRRFASRCGDAENTLQTVKSLPLTQKSDAVVPVRFILPQDPAWQDELLEW